MVDIWTVKLIGIDFPLPWWMAFESIDCTHRFLRSQDHTGVKPRQGKSAINLFGLKHDSTGWFKVRSVQWVIELQRLTSLEKEWSMR